jgi:hypothetical protein
VFPGELAASCQQILASRPDLDKFVQPMQMQILPHAAQTAGRMRVTADLPDLDLLLALACPSFRTEGGESAGVTVLLDTNVLPEPMRERPDAVVLAEL